MSFDAQRLYDLLPAIYRLKDAEQQEALRQLLAVIAREVGIVEENLNQLYDDQFIETCAEWVIPYIGDLVGCRALHTSVPVRHSSRAEVANTIAYRRRKGTAAILEQLARDVTGWSARAVEFFELLAATQYLNHIRPNRVQAPDLRQWESLERLNSAFDTVAHTVDVRRISVGQGRHNIPNVGIFLWRLGPYPLTRVPACKLRPEDPDDLRYLFNPLGCNSQLYTKPEAEEEITHLAEPRNVPAPISRRVLASHLTDYYGAGRSVTVFSEGRPVPSSDIEVCNLRNVPGGAWAHAPSAGKVAIDPVLGRLVLSSGTRLPVQVSWHCVFSMDSGGGEYERQVTFEPGLAAAPLVRVRHGEKTIAGAISELGAANGVVEVADGWTYTENLAIILAPGQRLELRAANGCRPLVRLAGPLEINGGDGAELFLNGLVIADQPLRVTGSVARLSLRHCTLVPGLALATGGRALHPGEPSIVAGAEKLRLELNHCITGPIRMTEHAQAEMTDSILDAGGEARVAYAGATEAPAASLVLKNSTVIGKLYARELTLVTNSILAARLGPGDSWPAAVRAVRRQQGCIRFSWLPTASLVPRRYRCQPDMEIAESVRRLESAGTASDAELEVVEREVKSWLVPAFSSTQYGDPDYCQLHTACPRQIVLGAEDEAEMGAFHDVYRPQREENLRLRLREYLRFGLEAGVFYESQRQLMED